MSIDLFSMKPTSVFVATLTGGLYGRGDEMYVIRLLYI